MSVQDRMKRVIAVGQNPDGRDAEQQRRHGRRRRY